MTPSGTAYLKSSISNPTSNVMPAAGACGSTQDLYVLLDAREGSIDHNMFAVPCVALPRNHLVPSKWWRLGKIGHSSFQPVTMFLNIRTHHLDFNATDLRPTRHFDPSIARDRYRIHRIRDHRSADAEVVRGDRTELASQLPCNCRLSHAGQSAKD